MIWRIQSSKVSASCVPWQPTSNEKIQRVMSFCKNFLVHSRKWMILKLGWLHEALCCQEHCYLLSRLLVLALSSLSLRLVGNCWAGKTFIWIIKSRAWLLFLFDCWKQWFCLKHLVLTYSITKSLLGINFAPDFALKSGSGFWDCSALEASHWWLAPAGSWGCPHPHLLHQFSG